MKIKYIFSINPGRAGSNYLANLFETINECNAFHEPEPIMNGKGMRQFLSKGRVNELEVRKKLEFIEKHSKNKVYAETNHCFIKYFAWEFIKLKDAKEMGIVVLDRPRTKIAQSLLRINCSVLSPKGNKWLINPFNYQSITEKPKIAFFMTVLTYILNHTLFRVSALNKYKPKIFKNVDLLYTQWYVDEVYALGDKFIKENPDLKVFKTNIEDLNTETACNDLLSAFGLSMSEKTLRIIGEAVNKKSSSRYT